MRPFPHQSHAVEKFRRTPRLLLCHAPGLGKTRTALWACAARGFNRLLILHPAKVSRQWAENIAEIFPGREGVHHFSWDSGAALKALPQLLSGDAVVLDEIHYLKNSESQRFRRLAPLLHQVIVSQGLAALGLSATPIYSYVSDAFAELFALGLVEWGQRTAFMMRYCRPKQGVHGFAFTDANEAALPQLRRQLEPYVDLVTWESSGIQMPPVTLENYATSLDLGVQDQATYREAAADFSGWHLANKGNPAPPLARFVTLRLLLAKAKVKGAFERLVEELRVPNFKILLFSSFKEPLFALKGLCDTRHVPAFLHTGDESPAVREKALADYAAHPGSAVILATIKSLGDAKDGLQRSGHRIFLLDMDYDPSSFVQLVGRLRRLGQADSVAVLRFFVPEDDLEAHITENIGRKEKFIEAVGMLNRGMAFSKL